MNSATLGYAFNAALSSTIARVVLIFFEMHSTDCLSHTIRKKCGYVGEGLEILKGTRRY